MKSMIGFLVLLMIPGLFMPLPERIALAAKGYGNISKEELKSRPESRDILIIDVRDGISWSNSGYKIAGAQREDPENVSSWAGKYPKDKTIVLY